MFCLQCQTPRMIVFSKTGGWKKVCIKCGEREMIDQPSGVSQEVAVFAQRGLSFFDIQAFEKASSSFRAAADKAGDSPEYLWAALLSDCGVKYSLRYIRHGQAVEFVLNYWKKDLTLQSARNSLLFKEVISLSADRGPEWTRYYHREIEAIDGGLRQIAAVKDEPYDIFFCFKDTDDENDQTPERKLLDLLYPRLVDEQLRVFYSPYSMKNIPVYNYEGYIYHALKSAKLLVVVTSSKDYIKSKWVRSEWKRFIHWNEQNLTSVMTCCIGGMSPADLPEPLNHINTDLRIPLVNTASSDSASMFNQRDVQRLYEAILRQYRELEGDANPPKPSRLVPVLVAGTLCGVIAVGSVLAFSREIDPLPDVNQTPVVTEKPIVTEKPVVTNTPAPVSQYDAKTYAKSQALIKDLVYVINDEGGVTITQYTGKSIADIAIPDIIDGRSVTVIGEDAFRESEVVNVTIPGSIDTIEQYAFWNCDQLESAVLSEGIRKLQYGVFGYCDKLRSLNIPASIKSINSIIPYSANLTELIVSENSTWIDVQDGFLMANVSNGPSLGRSIFGIIGMPDQIAIPQETQNIWDGVFRDQDNLTYVDIPEGVKEIRNGAFRYCDNLESVTLPASLETLGENVFADCPKLKWIYGRNDVARKLAEELGVIYVDLNDSIHPENLTWQENDEGGVTITLYIGAESEDVVIPAVIDGKPVTRIKEKAFSNEFYRSNARSVVVPSSVKVIEENAFLNCDQLESVVLSEGIQNLGFGAFSYCGKLRSLNIPASINSVNSIIIQCPSLTELTVSESSTWIRTENDLLIANDDIMGVMGRPEQISIPQGIESIWSEVFRGQNNLTQIDIPEGIKEIKNQAFRYCDNLEGVTLPASLETLGENVFADCPKLKWIYGRNDVARKLAEDLGVAYVDLNASVHPENLTWEENDKGGVTITGYTGAGNEALVIPAVIDGRSVTVIGEDAFRDSDITGVAIPGSVETIEQYAFYNCDQLESVVLSEGIRKLCWNAFGYCDKLRSLNIPASITSINSIIPYSPNLTELIVSENNTWIELQDGFLMSNGKSGRSVLGVIGKPDQIVIPQGTQNIWQDVFRDQDNLTDVDIPEGVKEIWNRAFRYCSKLESVTLPASLETLGENVFADCPKLKWIYGRNDVARKLAEELGVEFIDLNNPENIDFTQYFTYRETLDGGISLTKYTGKGMEYIIIPDQIDGKWVTEIGGETFRNNSEIISVRLGRMTKKIGSNSFENCANLEKVVIPAYLESYGTYALDRCTKLKTIVGDKNSKAPYMAKRFGAEFIEY